MAKMKAGKSKGKTNKIRRTVLGTLSGIFMISALIVAAIPVKDVEAVDADQIQLNECPIDVEIPNYADNNNPVFYREDGVFGVARVTSGTDEGAGVVVYYNVNGDELSVLKIDKEIAAYQYVDYDAEAQTHYLGAVFGNESPLYYLPDGVELDVSENAVFPTDKLKLCLAKDKAAWNGRTLYDENGNEKEQLVLTIRYIGSTRYQLDIKGDVAAVTGQYVNDGVGVFEGAQRFSTLVIEANLAAIGDNAFKKCSVRNVNLGNNVSAIGNHAFENCNFLSSVTLADFSDSDATQLSKIGNYAFANCVDLYSVDIPDQVQIIGAGCFMNCTGLNEANLYGHDRMINGEIQSANGNTNLNTLGEGAFWGCENLQRVYLPRNLKGSQENSVDVSNAAHWFRDCKSLKELTLPNCNGVFAASNVKGCSSLLTVTVPNNSMKFECGHEPGNCEGDIENCTFGKTNLGYNVPIGEPTLGDKFCIISSRSSEAYKYACRHEYTIKWDEGADYEGLYERAQDNYLFIVQRERDANGAYTNYGNLKYIQLYDENADTSILNIPGMIGGISIKGLDATFLSEYKRKGEIEYVYIPEAMESIGAMAFNGCEALSEVEFANAMSVKEIGDKAFYTETMDGDIKLHFVGTISREGVESEPFLYAMTEGNNYNDPNNPKGTKYISYTSPFPYNLQVELVVEKDETTGQVIKATPTLVDAPDFEEDFATGDYSLTSNPELKEKQNEIVRSAYAKYRQIQVSGNNANVTYSDNEAAVVDAVLRATIPEGVYNMNADVYKGNKYINSVILNSVTDVPDGAFAGCSSLKSFIMRSSEEEGGERIGAKVFEDDDLLTTVILPETLEEMDSLPFYKCSALEGVDFSGSPKFSCNNGIIYEKKDDGTQRIVECLELRGDKVSTSTISEEELANVSEIAPRAFEGCESIKQVLFGSAPLKAIPEYCFNNCKNLYYCEVSDQTEDIGDYAFRNTALTGIKIPEKTSFISGNAFVLVDEVTGETELIPGLIIECENPSTAYTYANHYGFTVKRIEIPEYTVEFYNYDGSVLLDTQTVKHGGDAVPPEAPEREGWVHTGWFPDYKNVTSNLQVKAEYEPAPEEPVDNRPIYTVTFYNYDGSLKISTQKVREGDAAKAPSTVPEREGYTFTGWLPEFDNIIEDTNVYAQYKRGSSDNTGNDGNNGNNGNDGNNGNNGSNGNNGANGSNGGNGTNNGANGANGSNGNNGSNGSNGSGSSSPNKGSVSGNNANRTNSGTKVNVNKSGISNSNLVSATVNGSSDDYIVKITDSEAARNAVEQALLNEYGSLDNIRYFAMDISLYDKTGTTKIQNTDGISVKITMPIPDALASYAGNNKAGAVINNNTLEKLQANFTTIDGVPCISFVATHFSPYTIYVDLDNMSANGTIDSTPVTGDPIHPKWFLSIGLALMSVMLFFMKGSKRRVVKVIPG